MQILVTGASGRLGARLLPRLADLGHQVVAWSGAARGARSGLSLKRVELADPHAVNSAIEDASPDVVIHTGAMSRAEGVRLDPARGWSVNVHSTETLCEWAAKRGRRLLFTSTDLVFDGTKSWYRESDRAAPLSEYGKTKLAAEAAVVSLSQGLVVRLSLLYGPSGEAPRSFFDDAMTALSEGRSQSFFADEFRTPLDYGTAALILVRLVESNASGVIHAGGPERLSRFELMRRAAAVLNMPPDLVRPNRRDDVHLKEPRPVDVSLDTTLLRTLLPDVLLPRVEAALARDRENGPICRRLSQ